MQEKFWKNIRWQKVSCSGEGEETFAELVAYYEGRGAAELINIHGITFREEEKQIAATPSRQIMDLSKVPFGLWGY